MKFSLKASPGNLQDMEDMIFVNNNEVSSNPIVMAIKISMKNDQKVKDIDTFFMGILTVFKKKISSIYLITTNKS